jgi:hypothetical protein
MQIERMGKAIPYMSAVHKSIYEHRIEKRQMQLPSLRYSRPFLLFRYILSITYNALHFPNPSPADNTPPPFLKFVHDLSLSAGLCVHRNIDVISTVHRSIELFH